MLCTADHALFQALTTLQRPLAHLLSTLPWGRPPLPRQRSGRQGTLAPPAWDRLSSARPACGLALGWCLGLASPESPQRSWPTEAVTAPEESGPGVRSRRTPPLPGAWGLGNARQEAYRDPAPREGPTGLRLYWASPGNLSQMFSTHSGRKYGHRRWSRRERSQESAPEPPAFTREPLPLADFPLHPSTVINLTSYRTISWVLWVLPNLGQVLGTEPNSPSMLPKEEKTRSTEKTHSTGTLTSSPVPTYRHPLGTSSTAYAPHPRLS